MHLKSFALLAFAWVPSVFAGPTLYSNSLNSTKPTKGCQQLAAKFPDLVSFPNSTIYDTENQEFWSESTVLSPWCIFTPTDSQDVAGALPILVATNTNFAIRGAGHMPIPGAASTNDGVLFAMDKFTTTKLAQFNGQTVAEVGCGLHWVNVYDWLAPQNLIVVGGRYAPVGVPGVLLGGGVSYFANTRGWAADHVLNYEVVTADGQILNVNAKSHSDLFWALKGAGQSNYGVVTRFDLEVFPIGNVYAGFITQAPAYVKQLVQAVASYVAIGGGSLDPNVAVVPTLEFAADTRTTTGVSVLFYNSSFNSAPKALENFTSIPVAAPSTVSHRTFPSYVNETIVTGTRGSRQLFRAGSLKSTPEAVNLIADTYLSLVPTLKTIPGCLVTLSYQELSQSFVQATHDNGPDAIGLDPANGPIMTFLAASSYDSPTDDTYLANFLTTLVDKINQAAQTADLSYPFVYLNDAAADQDPFRYYGGGKNLGRLRDVSRTYDPRGVFQKLTHGPFRLF